MKKILKVMLILIVLIIVCLCIMIIVVHNNKTKNNGNTNVNSDEFTINIESEDHDVQSDQEVIKVEKCIEYYINYLKDNNNEAIGMVLDKNYKKSRELKQLKSQVMDANIDSDTEIENYKFIATKMKKKEKDLDKAVYFVSGKSFSPDYSSVAECNFTVIIDDEQRVFSIIPENMEGNENYQYNWNIQLDQENYYNRIENENISNDDVILKYFEYYKGLAQNNYKQAFELLDTEYRKERFDDNVEKYNKYLQDIQIENITMEKYDIETDDDITEYIAKNDDNSYYIFRVKSPMNISILLDTYTVDIQQFVKKYTNAGEQQKIGMNAEKVISALNTKDYNYIYKKLDDQFKKNNFGTLEEFENYMKQNLNGIFDATYYNATKKNEVYEQPVTLKPKDSSDNDDNTKKLTIIMKLKEGTDFVMSFSIN